MHYNWLIMLPEILSVLFIITAVSVNYCREDKTPKTFFVLAQIFMVGILATSVVFYNKSLFPQFWSNTPFTTLFKSGAYILSFGWLYMSSKWFLNKNRPSGVFCCIVFALLLCLGILASATSFLTLSVVIPLICFGYILLILRHWDTERVKPSAWRFAFISTIFISLLWGVSFYIYHKTGSLSYADVKQYLNMNKSLQPEFLPVSLVCIALFMFLLGLVPFHIWFTDFIAKGVLPVCGFISLIPPLFYLCALVNILRDCFVPLAGYLSPLVVGFAFVSMIIGALSANGEKNLRKMFAFLSIYCLGFCLLGLVNFVSFDARTFFVCVLVYVISWFGVYTIFLGLKSHSEYLSSIDDIKGFSQNRPFMSAGMLIFVFSIIGLAPTLGFVSYMSMINHIIALKAWYMLVITIVGILLTARACLDVVRAVYFENPVIKYDRVDRSIYIGLLFSVLVIVVSLLDPDWIVQSTVFLGELK